MRLFRLLLLLTLTLPVAAPAMEKSEAETLLRIIALSNDIPAGEIDSVVVYNPADTTSAAEVKHLQSIIDGGLSGPNHVWKKILAVPAGGAFSVRGGEVVILVPGLTSDQLSQVSRQLGGQKVLTATTDMAYVRAQKCVLGLSVGDNVQILVSHQQLVKSGIHFDTAFQFMVNEI